MLSVGLFIGANLWRYDNDIKGFVGSAALGLGKGRVDGREADGSGAALALDAIGVGDGDMGRVAHSGPVGSRSERALDSNLGEEAHVDNNVAFDGPAVGAVTTRLDAWSEAMTGAEANDTKRC